MSRESLWARLGRTLRKVLAVEDWFTRERARTEPASPPHYRRVTIHQWIRDEATPATCVACGNQHGLALTWLAGHEELARFQCCECQSTWCDPLWANTTAIEDVLGNANGFRWSDPSPWFSDENLRVAIEQMHYEISDHQRRNQLEREEGEDR